MNSTDLYNWAPALRVMGMGLLLALGPLCWIALRHRQSHSAARLRALTVLTLFLTFDLILFGAFTRLTDSGLGCPDWPGCYGSVTPLGAQTAIEAAQTAMPTGPVTHGKAWIEMIHRYLATAVGVLILTLTAFSWSRSVEGARPWWSSVTLLWVCLQGAFGALTVTLKLLPAIVTLHLLGGLGLLTLLTVQAVRMSTAAPHMMHRRLRQAVGCVTALVWLQIALGAWVSTNYAVLACQGFPQCNGQWWPAWDGTGFEWWRELGHAANGEVLAFSALVSIHMVHRTVAMLVVLAVAVLAWRLKAARVLPLQTRCLIGLIVLQVCTGLSNVILGWPLFAAVLHTGGAAGLVGVLAWSLTGSRSVADNSVSLHAELQRADPRPFA